MSVGGAPLFLSSSSPPPLLLLFLLLLFLSSSSRAQEDPTCLDRFEEGQVDFVLDVDLSVKEGATFLSSPPLDRYRDCVAACCKEPRCNVAVMKPGAELGSVLTCFLFDCLYKQDLACKVVRKKGYTTLMLSTLHQRYKDLDQREAEADRPPVAIGGPDRVVQPQDTLTLNGIQSKDDVGVAAFQWTMLTEYPHAVIEKTNFDDQILVSNLTSGVYKFQLTVTDTIGQSDSTKVTVLVLTPEQSEHHCMAPKKVGPCRGSFPRWHYNAASEKCEEFLFGGCKENLNNYLTKDECSVACSGSEKPEKSGRGLPLPTDQVELCGAPCSAGQFSCANGCCLDRALECDSTPQCSDGSDEDKCEDLNDKFRILLQIPVDEQKVRCTELPATGGCRNSQTLWYYDPVPQDCLRFNYGGCQGNENKFDSKESCMKVCRGVTEQDMFARREEFERQESESQTGIIAIAAILGVAILVLLGVLIFCLTKGKKSAQHQRVPVYSAAADGDHLVYNTTTKPI